MLNKKAELSKQIIRVRCYQLMDGRGGDHQPYGVPKLSLQYTANGYRQTTDKLMFKSVISTVT